VLACEQRALADHQPSFIPRRCDPRPAGADSLKHSRRVARRSGLAEREGSLTSDGRALIHGRRAVRDGGAAAGARHARDEAEVRTSAIRVARALAEVALRAACGDAARRALAGGRALAQPGGGVAGVAKAASAGARVAREGGAVAALACPWIARADDRRA